MQVAEPKAPVVSLDSIEAGFGAAPKNQHKAPVEQAEAKGEAPAAPNEGTVLNEREEAPLTGKDTKELESGAEDLTSEERILLGLDQPVAEVEWSDDEKKKFKDFFGHDDPKAFKEEFSKTKQEHSTYGEENKQLKKLADRINKMDPHIIRALELEAQEKGAGQKYLKGLPDVSILSKDAKKISDRDILNAYVPDHGISDEAWEMLGDEYADADTVAALKKRIGFLRANAEDMHKAQQGSLSKEREAEEASRKEFDKRFGEAVDQTIAEAKNGPLGAFLTRAHENEVRSGKFISRFIQEDGISPTKHLMTTMLKAELYDSLKKAQEKLYKRGKGDGMHEMMVGLPSEPKRGRSAPVTEKKNNSSPSWLDDIERKAG